MLNNYKINIFHKIRGNEDFQRIKVFVDNEEIKSKNNYTNYITTEGVHKLRIEQVKIYKNKFFYILLPLYIILSFISGDLSLLENSPFYAIYEAEFYLNKNVDINVTIKKNIKNVSKFGKVILYDLNIIFNNDIKVKIIRDEIVTTTKDRKRWLVFNIIAGILPITLLIILFGILTINSISNQSSIFIIGMMIIFNKIWRKKLNAKILLIIGIGMLLIYQTIYKFLIVNIGFISIYNNTEQYVAGIGTYLQILIYGFLFVLININKDRIIQKNPRNLEYINLFSVSFIMMLLGIKNTLFMRMATYLNIFIILLIPELYNIYKLKDKKIEKICFYLCCIIYFFVYINSFGDVVPYHSIFEIK